MIGPGCAADTEGLMRSRRAVVKITMAVGAVAVAGCLGDEEPDTAPIDLTGECDVCGMEIGAHFGPSVQSFYRDWPSDRDGPAQFDSIVEFIRFDADRPGERLATYVTDYARVSYDIYEQDGEPHISTHTNQEDFSSIEDVVVVFDSDVRGAMGPDAIPFSNDDAALEFRDEYGGDLLNWDELTDVVLS